MQLGRSCFKKKHVTSEVKVISISLFNNMAESERGVVWEKSIIFIPPEIKRVFLKVKKSRSGAK
jgi:superfamily II RNA helicase